MSSVAVSWGVFYRGSPARGRARSPFRRLGFGRRVPAESDQLTADVGYLGTGLERGRGGIRHKNREG
jgi:hypothetical protein